MYKKRLHPCTFNDIHRPYSEQCHDRYESEAVRDRLTIFPMASAVITVQPIEEMHDYPSQPRFHSH